MSPELSQPEHERGQPAPGEKVTGDSTAAHAPHQLDGPRFAEHSVSWIAAQVADPAHHSGGVVVAAVTLAGAAATAELVFELAARRKRNARRSGEIKEATAELQRLREQFLTAADRDVAVFQHLIEAQREAQERRDSSHGDGEAATRLVAAYLAAADSPLSLAEAALGLMRLVEDHLDLGTRFTVSDLGAAAALAHGAIGAALLTAETNLALAHPHGDTAGDRARRIRDEAGALDRRIQERVRDRIRGR